MKDNVGMAVHDKRYSIVELANEFGLSQRALRFYEEKGFLHPRNAGGERLYSESDRDRLQVILEHKRQGFSLADIKEIMDMDSIESLRAKLYEQSRHLLSRKSDLEQAIDSVERHIGDIELKLNRRQHSNSA